MHKKELAMIMHRASSGLLFLLMLLSYSIAGAAGTTNEIENLLLFIEQSECTFVRNGNHYDALKAREHIEKKYTYYKERITTAEDFILWDECSDKCLSRRYVGQPSF